ncbi:MAG: response regulator [Clostridium sp.]|nr:response regulator [Clostridium sp.]
MINKVLIVEDDAYKEEQIVNYLKSLNNSINITRKHSLNSALFDIMRNIYELILLDMSIPTFDTNEPEHFKPYGGLMFLDELKRIKSETPVVIITQFSKFGEGKNEITMEQIKKKCSQKYVNYKDVIYFKDVKWKEYLKGYIVEENND